MGKVIHVKFGQSKEAQEVAHAIMTAIRDGMIERGELDATPSKPVKPLAKTDCARILLFGLPWYRRVLVLSPDGSQRLLGFVPAGADDRLVTAYVALDHTKSGVITWVARRWDEYPRQWAAYRIAEPKHYTLHKSMRGAREHCESLARRLA